MISPASLSANKKSQISVFPALGGLLFFLFGRLSAKYLGFLVLSVSLLLMVFSAPSFAPLLEGSFSRLEALNLPVATNTIQSEGSKKLADESVKLAVRTAPIPSNFQIERKLQVFATSYDKFCKGCSGITATGSKAGYGIVAVDPKVIPLGTNLYIPGYGLAVAGDTGGKIKGNKIDLGFENVKQGWWSARFVEIYVLK